MPRAGDLDALIARLDELRATEAPPGIEEARRPPGRSEHVLGVPPQLATPAGSTRSAPPTRRLERELDPLAASPFTAALKRSQDAVGELQREVEAGYRVALS